MKTSDLLSQTAIMPAVLSKLRQHTPGRVAPVKRPALGLPGETYPSGVRRYVVEGAPARPEHQEVIHHRPVTGKQRRAHELYLVRVAAEATEKFEREGLTGSALEARVREAVSGAAPLVREETRRTKVRRSELLDLGGRRR